MKTLKWSEYFHVLSRPDHTVGSPASPKATYITCPILFGKRKDLGESKTIFKVNNCPTFSLKSFPRTVQSL